MTVSARLRLFAAVVFTIASLAPCGMAGATVIGDVLCGGQTATIVGTDGDDYIIGTAGTDVIAGLDGVDVIQGGAGDDILCGDEGEFTRLYGQAGHDVLITVTGGSLEGGQGKDTLDASAAPPGTVEVDFLNAKAGVKVNLKRGISSGPGRDTLVGVSNIRGTPFNDRLTGDSGPNRVYLTGGDDQVFGLEGDDSLATGAGNDRVVGGRGDDSLSTGTGIDELIGGRGNDHMSGSSGNDTYAGGSGNDTLFESADDAGNDYLDGGRGDDFLSGGLGNDYGDGGTNGPNGDYCDVDIETKINCEQ